MSVYRVTFRRTITATVTLEAASPADARRLVNESEVSDLDYTIEGDTHLANKVEKLS